MGRKKLKTLYVDMDNVLVNFQSGIDALTEKERMAFKDDLDDVPGIFSKMKPVDGAIEAYENLQNTSMFIYCLLLLGTTLPHGQTNYFGFKSI